MNMLSHNFVASYHPSWHDQIHTDIAVEVPLMIGRTTLCTLTAIVTVYRDEFDPEGFGIGDVRFPHEDDPDEHNKLSFPPAYVAAAHEGRDFGTMLAKLVSQEMRKLENERKAEEALSAEEAGIDRATGREITR
ncbi:hypothetical protein [Aureimonas ureilytica]|uniref:hypothetical protein n=1 Tax=Aureimonas ureilytica TaxID=401562 RepID=UPI00036BAEC0|nr:hypothetical protein [Aureimonas ureilytica]